MLQTSDQSQWISVMQAVAACRAEDCETGESTIRYWAARYEGLAKKVGGRWRVNKPVLKSILEGDPPPIIQKERLTA